MKIVDLRFLALIVTFVLSLITLIISAKYAEWEQPALPLDSEKAWLQLLTYTSLIPFITLTGTALEITVTHTSLLPLTPETRAQSVLLLAPKLAQTAAWAITATLWTTCQVRTMSWRPGPTLSTGQSSVEVRYSGPSICPQRMLRDGTWAVRGFISTAMVVFGWIMLVVSALVLELSRRIVVAAGHAHQTQKLAQEDPEFENSHDAATATAGGGTFNYRERTYSHGKGQRCYLQISQNSNSNDNDNDSSGRRGAPTLPREIGNKPKTTLLACVPTLPPLPAPPPLPPPKESNTTNMPPKPPKPPNLPNPQRPTRPTRPAIPTRPPEVPPKIPKIVVQDYTAYETKVCCWPERTACR